MKTKILYLLHTDWAWIKQRSQFIAEELHGIGLDVTVVYKLSPLRTTLVRNRTPIPVRPLPFLPFQWRTNASLRAVDDRLWRTALHAYIRFGNFSHVIVTHPLLGQYVEGTNACLIYDCHDDNAEFYPQGKLKSLIEERHKKLLNQAELNIFSSSHLMNKYKTKTPSFIVRNGHSIDLDKGRDRQVSHRVNSDIFTIIYFGTISEWFNFNLLLDILEGNESVKFEIIGPADVKTIAHPRIKYIPPMAHGELLVYAQKADALIMPFVVNPLIEGVDPVKLYEYLAYDVPVLSVFYDELRHFEGLVDFYNTPEEAVDRVRDYVRTKGLPDIDKPARKAFLAKSTWRSRAAQYAAAITTFRS